MVADLGHLSLSNNLEKLSPSQHNSIETQPQLHNPSSGGGSWMWNPSHHHQQQVVAQPQSQAQQANQDDDSWEVRAFAEDTGNIMGTTWPPRSYTCTFCRREFRSAQALGGHMNVHRRDRARLHQMHHQGTASSSAALIIPAQELMAAAAGGGGGRGLCLLYQLPPNHNGGVYASTAPNINAWAAPPGLNHHHPQNYNISGELNSSSIDYSNCKKESSSSISIAADNTEELDLELRL